MVIIVVGAVYCTASALLYFSFQYSLPLFIGLSTYMVWSSISIKSLGTEARSVVNRARDRRARERTRAPLEDCRARHHKAL